MKSIIGIKNFFSYFFMNIARVEDSNSIFFCSIFKELKLLNFIEKFFARFSFFLIEVFIFSNSKEFEFKGCVCKY